jgi:translation initiation factor 3 subunit C
MSSRFFRGDSDSESSSEEEEELYGSQGERSEEEESEEDEDEDADEDDDSSSEDDAKGKGASWFLRGDADDSDDSDDEDRERVVKSAKDKRLDELEGTIKLIDNAEKIGDWAVINAGMYRRRTERAQADGLQNLTR